MNKFFNTAGPIRPDDHYHIPSLERIDWEEVKVLMASKKYFLLHAPRQTGKTSALLEMMETLNRAGEYNALYANIEGAQASRNDKETGISGVCSVI
ncbi:MAG TPA: ATP-binding protein, partial [Gammaproteobacteria bacterium]|nr:ATP-binding protein [Gammaproteobacteria bacterium]